MAKWREIQTVDEWQNTLTASEHKLTLLFKHSTRCPISAAAWNEYQEFVQITSRTDIDFIMVKVIQSRDVSNEIERDLQVKHESPQAILLQNRLPVWHESHQYITKAKLQEIIEN